MEDSAITMPSPSHSAIAVLASRMAQTNVDMVAIAYRVLQENGFVTEIPRSLDDDLPSKDPKTPGTLDLRELPWSSIDNHDSKDLDQLEVAERLANGNLKLLVAIADVDGFAPKGSAIDAYAAQNCATLYTGVKIFPMLPDELSSNRSSLLPRVDRLSVVTEMVIDKDGNILEKECKVYRALVHNHAKLIYEEIGAWLAGDGDGPKMERASERSERGPSDPVIAEQVRMQDEFVQRMRAHRYRNGALDFDTVEARPVTENGRVVNLVVLHKSRARELVEDIMIAVNQSTARLLELHGFSSIRRVVRRPKRWDRIVELAASYGFELPPEPSSERLSVFLAERRKKDPDRFGDVSLAVVKLLGPGEYVVQRATDADIGHFGLAVQDYNHSTAPNRRYPDLITQRLLKAMMDKKPQPYSDDELLDLAAHATDRENAARKVERTMRKVAAADFLSTRVGETFDAIVTGSSSAGTFARLISPPAEGRVVQGERGIDVGDKVRVRLLGTNIERGFIDFAVVR